MGIFDLFKGKRETALRVNWDDTEDIGIVTHYKDKPLTGIAYGLHDNGSISEEVEMLDGLKHGQGVDYNEESNIIQTTIYENDLIVDFDEDTWNCLLDDIFQKDNYEYELIDMNIQIAKKFLKDQHPNLHLDRFNEKVIERLLDTNKMTIPDEILEEVENEEVDEMMDKFGWDKNDEEKRSGLKDAIKTVQVKEDNIENLKKEVSGLKSKILGLANKYIDNNEGFNTSYIYNGDGRYFDCWGDEGIEFSKDDEEILEKIVCKYFTTFYSYNAHIIVYYHPDFKLTLEIYPEDSDDMDNSEDYELEYEIKDDGIIEIEYGSTAKFLKTLKK